MEAAGKDGQEISADGTRQTGKESQEKRKNGLELDQAKKDEKNRKERSNRFRKDEEIKDLKKTVGEQVEVIKNLQEIIAK